jgi:para-aminobenzoate synthetase / 4-amino-4-deoxychorismate lyase
MFLLDDVKSSREHPSSRLYEHVKHAWRVDHASELENCFAQMQAALDHGDYLVTLFSYELGYYFQGIPCKYGEQLPLIRAWSFTGVNKCSKEEVDHWLADVLAKEDQVVGVMNLRDSITSEHFNRDITRIQEWIRSGDTYQINHSYRITGEAYGSPLALYAQLRERQPGRYGAYLEGGSDIVLSQSPELFIKRTNGIFEAQPMKGTADARQFAPSELSNDPKNQAENVMIVDLLRNDLGRISEPGSVQVPALFEVNRHGNVLQMTSTVRAKARPQLRMIEILRAVFPCGSVTGAPKKRSMEIIQDLENSPRNWSCGALGWFDPNGDFALSVPIRTLQVQRDSHSSTAQFVLGVGAGITIDSDPIAEYEECQIKAAFLSSLPSGAGLFETIRFHAEDGVKRIALYREHLDRLSHSAKALRIPLDINAASALLEQSAMHLPTTSAYRVRLDLSRFGELSISSAVLDDLPPSVKVFWAHEILEGAAHSLRMQSNNPLLLHKTTQRSLYDLAWQKAVSLGGFDALFMNERGALTEGGRTSIFVRPPNSDEWLTPPLSAGVLPGVMRTAILRNPSLKAREANLTIEDVISANEIMLSNALRGMIKAHL